MEKIIAHIKELETKNIITIDSINEQWLDDVAFSKGNVKFWIYEDGDDEITMEVFQVLPDNIQKTLYDKELENITTMHESMIFKLMTEIINDMDLYKKRREFLEKRLNKLVEDIQVFKDKMNASTTDEDIIKYQKRINRRMQTYEKLSKEHLTCINFEEYTIIKEGVDNRVLVQWHREKSTMFPDGKEYSIHIKSPFGLICGNYYIDKDICFKDFDNKYGITDTEIKMMQWVGMNKEVLKDFMEYAEKQGFHISGYNDDMGCLKNLYTYFYKLGR